MHDAILDFAEVMSLILGADSYEVDTSFVIVKGRTGRFTIIVTRGVHIRCVLEIQRKSSNNLNTQQVSRTYNPLDAPPTCNDFDV